MDINNVKLILGLEDSIWEDLDDDLLKLCFTSKSKNNVTIQEYGLKNYELLEFMGDAILETIITLILYEYFGFSNKITEGNLTQYRSELVKNTTLYCHMNRKNLISYIIFDSSLEDLKIKQCADVLEAIIGGLFYYLNYIKNYSDSMDIIKQWYYNNFYVEESLDYISKNKKNQYIISCNKNNKLKSCSICELEYI